LLNSLQVSVLKEHHCSKTKLHVKDRSVGSRQATRRQAPYGHCATSTEWCI